MSKWSKAMGYFDAKTELSVFYKKDREYMGVAYEALRIADRLERADVTNHSGRYECDDFYDEEGISYACGFKMGYNQALADVRGDDK